MKTPSVSLRVLLCAMPMVSWALSGCGLLAGGGIERGGYVIDISTGNSVLEYKMIVETAGGSDEASVDNDTGKFNFKIPGGADYVIYVSQEGYRDFKSSNVAERPITDNPEVNENSSPMINVPLVPTSMGYPPVNAKVIDDASGTPINSGSFRVVKGAVEQTLHSSLYGDGNTGHRFWVPDAAPVAGHISAGEFIIEGGSLIPGFNYNVTTFGVEGYRDKVTTLNIGTTNINTSVNINIKLVQYSLDTTNMPVLIAQSHLGLNKSSPVPISDRTITFTFDRNIELDLDLLKGLGAHQLIASITTVDDDQDGVRTPTVKRAESLSASSYSQWVTVEVRANTLIVTLAPDNQLIDLSGGGSIDLGDRLSYTLDANTVFSNIKVRQVDYPYEGGWYRLNDTGSPSATVVIRYKP